MNWLIRWILTFLGHRAQVKIVHELKRQGITAYLRLMQGTRAFVILVLVGAFVFQWMILSMMGALVTGFWLWDYDFRAKVEILFWIFCAMFSLPLLALVVGLSQRVWYRATGAKQMVDDFRKSA